MDGEDASVFGTDAIEALSPLFCVLASAGPVEVEVEVFACLSSRSYVTQAAWQIPRIDSASGMRPSPDSDWIFLVAVCRCLHCSIHFKRSSSGLVSVVRRLKSKGPGAGVGRRADSCVI